MNKTFLCTLLMLSCFIKSHAQAPSKEVCWAKGSGTELKFGLDYRSDAYHLLLKNIKESNNVAIQNDRYVFKTNDGNTIEATLTEEIMSSTSGDGYYSFTLTPKQINCLSTGLASIEMIRGGKATSFDLYNYTSSNMQKAAVQVRHDSIQAEKQKVAEEKARQHAEIAEEKARQHAETKQKKKEEYEAWIASRTPEYLATVKDYSYVYGGYSREGNNHDGENGAKIGILHAINLSKRAPLFIELGGEVGYYHSNHNIPITTLSQEEKISSFIANSKNHALSATVPISLSYKYVHKKGFSVIPYLGINFKYSILNKDISSVNNAGYNIECKYDYLKDIPAKTNVISEGEDSQVKTQLVNGLKAIYNYKIDNRFQFGGQIGVRIGYKNIYFGAEYRRLTPYIKHGNGVNVWNVTAGYMF